MSSPILVDSSVLLDVATKDKVWFEWSVDALANATDAGQVVINPLIYAEVSVRYATMEELDELLVDFKREGLPYEAGFLAGKAYKKYRGRGGKKTSPMPDFYIGAHAAVMKYSLLTRDPKDLRKYFPRLELIAPSEN
jgi:hypothetical protein